MKFLNKRPERLFRHLRYATFEAQFMKKLSNTEAELKKSIASTKKRVFEILTMSILSFRLRD